MKEKENNQHQRVNLPPAWCGAICGNAMNEICIEHCAVKRDCSAFEPKSNLKLSDMPHFPLHETGNMTKEEKFTSVTIYVAKMVDHLQGNEDCTPVVTSRGSRKSITQEMGEVTSSLRDLQNEMTEESGNTSHKIDSSENIVNKEQE